MSPIGLALVPPIPFPDTKSFITGVRISAGIFNLGYGNVTIFPAQIAGIANIGDGRVDIYGLKAAVGLNYIPKGGTVTLGRSPTVS